MALPSDGRGQTPAPVQAQKNAAQKSATPTTVTPQGAAAPQPATPVAGQAEYEAAMVKFTARDYARAIEGFSAALRINNRLVLAYYHRGLAKWYGQPADKPGAEADFKVAIGLAPKFAEAYGMRGRYFVEQQKFEQARAFLDAAITLLPETAWFYNARGPALVGLLDYKAAEADYIKAVELAPQTTEFVYNRAWFYLSRGRYAEAAVDMDAAMEKVADNPNFHLQRGKVRLARGDFTSAVADLQRVVELRPQFAGGHEILGYIYYAREDWEKAVGAMTQAADLRPETAGYPLVIRHLALGRLGRTDGRLQSLVSLEKDEWMRNLGQMVLGQRAPEGFSAPDGLDHDGDRDYRRKACDGYFYMAQMYLRAGKTDLAREALKQAAGQQVFDNIEQMLAGLQLRKL